ncbi:MAG: hypothetical protein QOF72_3106 [Blastocatellia bacterium]|jgi:hypothetical protein|nr:hypothetical protein [Blastocatellia bacterium]
MLSWLLEIVLSILATIAWAIISVIGWLLSAVAGLALTIIGLIWSAFVWVITFIFSLALGWQIVVFLFCIVVIPALAIFGLSYAFELLSMLPLGSRTIARITNQFSSRLRQIAENTFFSLLSLVFRFELPQKGEILYYANIADTVAPAISRQSFLLNVPEIGPVYERFVEVPPGYDSSDVVIPERTFVDAVAHGATLRWERASGEAELLFGRASDAVRAVMGRLRISDQSVSLSLRPLGGWEMRPTRYPWIVSIGYEGPSEPLKEALANLRSWIGIGIEISKPIKPIPFGVCGSPTRCAITCNGTIAGVLRDSSTNPAKEYLITCDHVVPRSCTNLAAPRPKIIKADAPDAVLLLGNSPCFQLHHALTAVPAIGAEGIERAVLKRTFLHRLGGISGRTRGIIVFPRVTFPFGEGISTFPAFCARLYRRKFFWFVPWPLRKSFSLPGDSGSWVVIKRPPNDAQWAGMVQSGNGFDTVVLHSTALVDHFRNILAAQSLDPLISEMM